MALIECRKTEISKRGLVIVQLLMLVVVIVVVVVVVVVNGSILFGSVTKSVKLLVRRA